MPVKREVNEKDGIYFITFTCQNWIPLFEITNTYSAVYKWFHYLRSQGHYVVGYCIMPNHLHLLAGFRNKNKSINTIVSNGKRFIAYEIVKQLQNLARTDLLIQLADSVTSSDKKKGKLHQVFTPSFDWKECRSDVFVEQKLSYIHDNPCRGIWNLAEHPEEYQHSSARFYVTGEQGVFEVTNYKELQDINLTEENKSKN